jgi:N6-adenosine-specific RNA methylase IME4
MSENHHQLLDGLPKRHFNCIYADPPWFFRPRTGAISSRDPRNHYNGVMTADTIAALPVGDYASKDAHLFLWTTGPCLEQAFHIIQSWGFRYSGVAFTWVKLRSTHRQLRLDFAKPVIADSEFHLGLGFTTRKNAEFCLLARRGNAKRIAKDVRELIIAPVREHSRKPDEAAARIERYTDGPYLELFATEERPNWTSRGNQLGKFL